MIFSFLRPPSVGKDNGNYKTSSLFSEDCLSDNKKVLVKAVCDGDTISLTNCKNDQKENKIRLIGIDAFEMGQKPFGEKGRKFLADLVLNKKVCIELDKDKEDKYERTLGYVFVDGSEVQGSRVHKSKNHIFFINEELIKNGLAIVYNFPPNVKYVDRLKDAQTYARDNMLGIWENMDYLEETPYEFRHKKNTVKKGL